MDSGNSGGSLQSSTDADDEYDSRATVDSFSAFFTSGLVSNPPTQPSAPPSSFDPFSNFFHLHQNPNMALPGSGSSHPVQRSDPSSLHPLLSTSPAFTLPNLPPPPPPQPPQSQNPAAVRNPRKRSRASRRAPTTVLTTDTTNFRAMVQEFTGIPSPPFSNSPFARTRFDPTGTLFTSLDGCQPPPYLRRPFAQKIQSPLPLPFLASSPSLLTPPSAVAAIDSGVVNQSTATSIQIPQINYQFPISKSSPNPFTLNNPSPILQINPKFPIPPNPPPIDQSKPQTNSFEIFPSNDDHFINLGTGSHSPSVANLLASSDHTNAAARWSHDPSSAGFSFRPNFHGEKSPENDGGAGRGEGMVESSWICSSSE